MKQKQKYSFGKCWKEISTLINTSIMTPTIKYIQNGIVFGYLLLRKLTLIQNQLTKMYEESRRDDNIVRMVYTYTAGDNHLSKSIEKPKKRGITRITQGQSASKQKPQIVRHSQYRPPNDQNYDHSNRNYQYDHKVEMPTYEQLYERNRDLENELILVEKEKLELQRNHLVQKNNQKEEHVHLVQSQFIACNEDIQKWEMERGDYQRRIEGLIFQNDLLKVNTEIQARIIDKMKAQAQQVPEPVEFRRQTNQEEVQTAIERNMKLSLQLSEIVYPDWQIQFRKRQKAIKQDREIQCGIDIPLGSWQEIQQYSSQMDAQTHELRANIEGLQRQKNTLQYQKEELLKRIQKMEKLQDKCFVQAQQKKEEADQIKFRDIELKHKLLVSQDEVQRIEGLLAAKEHEITYKTRTFEDEIERLQEQLAAAKEQVVSRYNAQKMDQNQYLLRKIDQREVKNKNLTEENERMMDELRQSARQLKKQVELIERYQQQIRKKSELICLLESELSKKDSLSQYSKEQYMSTSQSELIKREEEIKGLRAQIVELYHRNEQKNYELTSVRHQNLSLMQQIEAKNAFICKLEQQSHQQLQGESQLRNREDLIRRLRGEVDELSHKYSEKALQCAQGKQQLVDLRSQLNHQESMSSQTHRQLAQITREYSAKVNQIEDNMRRMEIDLQKEVEKHGAMEAENASRLELFKRDYDVLYNKYMKYKNMAIVLQNKRPNPQFS